MSVGAAAAAVAVGAIAAMAMVMALVRFTAQRRCVEYLLERVPSKVRQPSRIENRIRQK